MAEDGDEGLPYECLGYAMALYSYSALHLTDMIIDESELRARIPRPRYERALAAMTRCGLLRAGTIVDGWRQYHLMDDEDGFFHVKTRLEVETERRRGRDKSNPRLTGEVKRRDGDACRYCGKVVSWGNTGSGKQATYDHLLPDGALEPTRPDQLVVCCISCNSSLGARPHQERMALLLRPPARPYYRRSTLAFLAKHGIDLPESYEKNEARWQPASAHMAPIACETTPADDSVVGARGTQGDVGTPVSTDHADARGSDAMATSTAGRAASPAHVDPVSTATARPGRQEAATSRTATPAISRPTPRDHRPRQRKRKPRPPHAASLPAVTPCFPPAQAVPGQCPGSKGALPGQPGSGRDGQNRHGSGRAARAPRPATMPETTSADPTDLPIPRRRR
ncbi:hypothetical protein JT358_11640 [Micrococcales bacterium 31B]|nr:hypothetical protein [Micrococcales bacterium 31B]